MKKVFISHSYQDKKFVELLEHQLSKHRIKTFNNYNEIVEGDNVAEKITSLIEKTDYVIVVFSKNGVKSKWVNFELSATLINEISRNEIIIIPIIIEDCEVPYSLQDRNIIDLRTVSDGRFKDLADLINSPKSTYASSELSVRGEDPDGSREYQVNQLRTAFFSNDLTLFCGSGTSYDANVPTWNTLLKKLFKAAYPQNEDVPNIDEALTFLFQKKMSVSPLIIGQYLKNLLGKSFTSEIKNALYEKCTYESNVVKAIVNLCKENLKCIITFNFDDLFENKLKEQGIKHKSIYASGQRSTSEQVTVFHPHGFLPNDKKTGNSDEIVFSEDGYHSQFIESFSWSNLVQLNHLDNRTCLFIGISLTDPNMRRLLDVSSRKYNKSGKRERNHFIIKRRHSIDEFYKEGDELQVKDDRIIKIIEKIEEQDANDLGFHVIWVKGHEEIPSILDEIRHTK